MLITDRPDIDIEIDRTSTHSITSHSLIQADLQFGGAGSDSLFGAHGNNTLIAGGGLDTLKDGDGYDCFVFLPDGSTDLVTAFQPSIDSIDLGDSKWTGITFDSILQTQIQGGWQLTIGTTGIHRAEVPRWTWATSCCQTHTMGIRESCSAPPGQQGSRDWLQRR